MQRILPVIVVSQFFCTSVWFAGNAVMADLVREMQVSPGFVAHLTSAVQFGFIGGTLVFALLAIADRFSPSLVFFASALAAAVMNAAVLLPATGPAGLLGFRVATGFFLAGIYPVGMKIAADHYSTRLGRSLGWLVGALVLGTAFPHLVKSVSAGVPWRGVMVATSALAVVGGAAIWWLVPNGPYRKPGKALKADAFLAGFKVPGFRAAAIGYFGHMWELYAFWAFLPVFGAAYLLHHPTFYISISLLAFVVIGTGAVACVLGGVMSQRVGPRRVAAVALAVSGMCCLLSPWAFGLPPVWFMLFLLMWGAAVIADSPMFSTLVAGHAPGEVRGSSLTIVNCIGFAITIVSIQLLYLLMPYLAPRFLYLPLALGPVAGLVGSRFLWSDGSRS